MSLERLPVIEDEQLYHRPAAAPFLQFGMDDESDMPTNGQTGEPQADSAPVLSDEQLRMQELDRMLQEAQSRADMVEREAYDKAYAAGEKSGLALGEKRAEQTIEQMEQLLKQAEMQLGSLDYMCREAILDISEAVVKHVLDEMGKEQYSLLMKAVERAAFQFPDLSTLVLLVNPNDMQTFEALLPESSLHAAHIRVDASVEEGSCRLMSEKQDAWVNPNQALRDSFTQLRQQFLQA